MTAVDAATRKIRRAALERLAGVCCEDDSLTVSLLVVAAAVVDRPVPEIADAFADLVDAYRTRRDLYAGAPSVDYATILGDHYRGTHVHGDAIRVLEDQYDAAVDQLLDRPRTTHATARGGTR